MRCRLVPKRSNMVLRFIDRVVGVPLVALYSFLLKPSKSLKSNSIAVVSVGAIGDLILLSAPIVDLKKSYPDCKVTLFTNYENNQIANLIPSIDNVVGLPLANPAKAVQIIKKSGKFDVCIDSGQWSRISALYCAMIKAKNRIGFCTPRQFRHYCFDTRVPHRADIHELDNFRNLFKTFGINLGSIPTFSVKTKCTQMYEQPYVVLHMFPSGTKFYLKEWGERKWEDVATYLAGHNYVVIITGSSQNAMRAESFVEKFNNSRVISLAGKTSLADLACVLANSETVVSVNTGVMHLAAAVDARIIAIHGPTSPLRWGPVQHTKKAKIITPQNVLCAPCLNLGFEYGCNASTCMKSISAESVIEALRGVLDLT